MNRIVVFLIDENKDFTRKIQKRLESKNFVVYPMYCFDEAMEYYYNNIITPDMIVIGEVVVEECDGEDLPENPAEELIMRFNEKYPSAKKVTIKYDCLPPLEEVVQIIEAAT